MMNRHHKNMRQMPVLLAGGLLVATALGAFAQLSPGQLPPGPPAQPGQLSTEPKKTPEKKPESPAKNEGPAATPEPTGEDVIRTSVENVLVPTTVFDPD